MMQQKADTKKQADTLVPFLLGCILFFSNPLLAQQEYAQPGEKIMPREFGIPPSPLFDLMGTTPSMVAKSAALRDFKVDWSFRSWRLNPNLAIESQPIWEIFYNKKNLEKYRNASPVARLLSTTSLSLGTIVNDVNDRRVGGAVKINLYQEKDPLLEKEPFEVIQQQFDDEYALLVENERYLLKRLDSVTLPSEVAFLKQQLKENDVKLGSFYSRRNDAIKQKSKEIMSYNWNASFVDLAWGKVKTFQTDSVNALKRLRLNRNTCNGVWLNFGLGVGKRGMITGLMRNVFYEEQVNFILNDANTGEQTALNVVANNRIFTAGINFRYGGPVYNFFLEFIHESKSINSASDIINEKFMPVQGKQIIQSSVQWEELNPYNISFGGDWRVSRNVVLNFGMRLVMDGDFKTRQVIPNATIGCMMR